jgi:predicted TIM-barrel fold metal-dependent hydrolase
MIIDVHCHYSQSPVQNAPFINTIGKMWGIEKPIGDILHHLSKYEGDTHYHKLVEDMDRSGVNVSVLFFADNIDEGENDEQVLKLNEHLADIEQKHPKRIISFASIDPRRLEAPDLFRTCIEDYRLRGLKWHPTMGYYPNSPEAYRVLEVAEKLDVPLLTHTGPLLGMRSKHSHPIHLDDVGLDFPKLRIIAAHMGDTWWRDWVATAKYNKNIFGDLSMWQLMAVRDLGRFRRILREIIDDVGMEQVLFASDAPYFESHVSNRKWVDILRALPDDSSDGIEFTVKEVEAILGGNATKLLNL